MQLGMREMVFAVLLVATPVVAWLWVFAPMSADTEQILTKARDKRERLDRLAEATASQDDLGVEIKKLSRAIGMFEKKLPAKQQMDVILRQVWELADKHQLEARSIRNDEPVQTPNYIERPIRMEIVGDFDGFYAFLLDLERLPRITRLKQFDITKVDQKKEGVMKAELVLTIYFEGRDDLSQARKDASSSTESQT